MKSEIIKDLLKLKLKLVDEVIDMLPGSLGDRISTVQNDILSVVLDVAGEHLKNSVKKDEEKSVKFVTIE